MSNYTVLLFFEQGLDKKCPVAAILDPAETDSPSCALSDG